MELRPYQAEGIDALRQSFLQGVRRICVQSPTGSGKTKIAAAITQGAMRKQKRVAFCVPRIDLIDQTLEEFAAEGITEVGVIQANHVLTDWSKPIQVCSIQTIQSKEAYPEADVVLFDECHSLFLAHRQWMAHPDWATVPFIGLSATPWTKGLGRFFDSLLVMATTRDLINDGFLSRYRVFAASHPDLSRVTVRAGDYVEKELSSAMQQDGLTADIVQSWQKLWGKDKTLLFGVDRAHAQSLQARFLEIGVPCGYQDAHTPSFERAKIKRAFHSGELRAVANVDTLTTGVDWDVRCLSLCRPTHSEIRYVQIIGRALRVAPGKGEAIILDHSDTTQRLGFVSDIHHEHLNGGRFGERVKQYERPVPVPKECMSCHCLVPPGTKICPACGTERRPPQNGIVEADGELVEYVGGGKKVGDPNKVWSMPEKREFYAQLLGYAETFSHKPGWAAHRYRAKFEVWPRGMDGVEAKPPGLAVMQWIKKENRRYREQMAKEGRAAPYAARR